MFKINKQLEYALIALKHLKDSEEKSLVTAKMLSELYNCPFDPTSKALQRLSQRGLLGSTQGTQGGYMIVGNLETTSFLDLMIMICGSFSIANCFSRCDKSSDCTIFSPIATLNKKMTELFKSLPLSELLESSAGVEAFTFAEVSING